MAVQVLDHDEVALWQRLRRTYQLPPMGHPMGHPTGHPTGLTADSRLPAATMAAPAVDNAPAVPETVDGTLESWALCDPRAHQPWPMCHPRTHRPWPMHHPRTHQPWPMHHPRTHQPCPSPVWQPPAALPAGAPPAAATPQLAAGLGVTPPAEMPTPLLAPPPVGITRTCLLQRAPFEKFGVRCRSEPAGQAAADGSAGQIVTICGVSGVAAVRAGLRRRDRVRVRVGHGSLPAPCSLGTPHQSLSPLTPLPPQRADLRVGDILMRVDSREVRARPTRRRPI